MLRLFGRAEVARCKRFLIARTPSVGTLRGRERESESERERKIKKEKKKSRNAGQV